MAIYHLTVKSISRGKGSAKGRSDYIEREGKYQKDAAEIVHKESGNMPAWAETEPREYWQAADDYERANGRLFKQVEFALPRELTPGQQIELARAFCRELAHCPDGPLPYSMAIHRGHGQGNPHCHLMISERVNDGHDRSPVTWFRRASPGALNPGAGGAKKTTALHPQEWLISTREKWAEQANIALAHAGHHASIDHRTLAAQGIERPPTYHLGPAAAAMERKGHQSDRGERQREEETERQRQAHALEEAERQAKDARALALMIDQGRAKARAEYEAWKTERQRQRQAEQERQRQRKREEEQRRQQNRRQNRDRGPSIGM